MTATPPDIFQINRTDALRKMFKAIEVVTRRDTEVSKESLLKALKR